MVSQTISWCNLSWSSSAEVFTLTREVTSSLLQESLSCFLTLLNIVYIWTGPKYFPFLKSKLITPPSRLRPCTLWIVHAQDRGHGIWVRLMVGETEPFGIGMSASHFSIGTTQITLLNSFGIFSFLSIFLLCILRIK